MRMSEYLLPFLLKISSKMYLFSTLNWSKCTYFCLFWCTYNKNNSRNTTAFRVNAMSLVPSHVARCPDDDGLSQPSYRRVTRLDGMAKSCEFACEFQMGICTVHIVPGRKKFSYHVPKIFCTCFHILGPYFTK